MSNASLKDDIRAWWASAPMTYGDRHGEAEYVGENGFTERVTIGSRRFFELADKRFLSWNTPLHVKGVPFSGIFDYEKFRGKRVLEVGCGMGFMAMNWAQHGAQLTAVDLNPVAVEQTKRRLAAFGLEATVQEADGESLSFPDGTFDYVYSWGVLHHSPSPAKSVGELYRVLKPGGSAGVMLYNRDSLLYRYTVAFVEGFMNMERLFLSELELASRYGDGGREEGNPHTWPVTKAEVRRDLFAQFTDVSIRVLGTDVPPILNAWRPNLASRLTPELMERLAARVGWSLWITGGKSP